MGTIGELGEGGVRERGRAVGKDEGGVERSDRLGVTVYWLPKYADDNLLFGGTRTQGHLGRVEGGRAGVVDWGWGVQGVVKWLGRGRQDQ